MEILIIMILADVPFIERIQIFDEGRNRTIVLQNDSIYFLLITFEYSFNSFY